MKTIGVTLLGFGVIVLLAGLLKSGAAEYSDTLNIGLLNDKTNLTLAGGFAAVVGAIFASASILAEKIGGQTEQRRDQTSKGDL